MGCPHCTSLRAFQKEWVSVFPGLLKAIKSLARFLLTTWSPVSHLFPKGCIPVAPAMGQASQALGVALGRLLEGSRFQGSHHGHACWSKRPHAFNGQPSKYFATLCADWRLVAASCCLYVMQLPCCICPQTDTQHPGPASKGQILPEPALSHHSTTMTRGPRTWNIYVIHAVLWIRIARNWALGCKS